MHLRRNLASALIFSLIPQVMFQPLNHNFTCKNRYTFSQLKQCIETQKDNMLKFNILRDKALICRNIISIAQELPIKRFKFPKQNQLQSIITKYQQTKQMDTFQNIFTNQNSVIGKTLLDYIIQYINSQVELSQQARKQILKIFYQGVTLFQNQTQLRFKKATKLAEVYQADKGVRLLKYCPNFTVTGQIFINICNLNGQSLLTGHYGIAKSFAFSFYRKISDNIFQYYIQARKRKGYLEVNSQFKKYLLSVPKLFYWTITQQDDQQSIKNNILRQCYQFDSTMKSQFFNHSNQATNSLTTKEIYKYYIDLGIQTFLVVDQINHLASLLRQNKNQPNQEKIQIINRLIKTNQKINSQFLDCIYLSSVNIQYNLLKDLKLTPNTQHQPLNIVKVQFSEILERNSAKRDLIQYFLFELKEKLIIQKFFKDTKLQLNLNQLWKLNLDKIKKICRDQVISIQKQGLYITPYKIRVFFEKKSMHFIKNQNRFQSINSLIEKLPELLRQVNQQNVQELKYKFNKFLKKDHANQQERYKIACALYYRTEELIRNKDQLNKQFIYPLQIKIPTSEINIKNINQNVDKQLFFYNENNNSLQCLLPYRIIHESLKYSLPQIRQKIVQLQLDFRIFLEKGVTYGLFIEHQIIMMLSKGKTDFEFDVSNQKGIRKFQCGRISSILLSYDPIPKQNQNVKHYNFLQRIKWYSEAILNSDEKCFVLLPIKLKNFKSLASLKPEQILKIGLRKQFIQQNAKSIDFMILKVNFVSGYQKFQIHAFDVTQDLSQVKAKMLKFVKEFCNFKDKYQCQFNNIEFELRYWIIAPYQQHKNSTQVVEKYQNTAEKMYGPMYNHNFLTQLKERCSNEFSFKYDQNARNVIEMYDIEKQDSLVNSNQHKNSTILKSIGIISYLNDIKLTNRVYDIQQHKKYLLQAKKQVQKKQLPLKKKVNKKNDQLNQYYANIKTKQPQNMILFANFQTIFV